MGNFWKDLAGPHYETLEKAIYRKETGRVLDALPEVYTPLLAVPRGLMSWVIQNVKPIEVNETKKLEVPGSDAVLEIRKILSDTYSGTIVSKGKVIHQFEMIPLPAVAGTLLSVLELYDDVAGRKVEEVEKKEDLEQEVKAIVGIVKPLPDTSLSKAEKDKLIVCLENINKDSLEKK